MFQKLIILSSFLFGAHAQEQNGCDETVFGRLEGKMTCFTTIEDLNANRWGWTNRLHGVDHGADEYVLDMYAGAGQCIISDDRLVGELTVDTNGTKPYVSAVVTGEGVTLGEFAIYFGVDPLPSKNDKYTVAPGQYPYHLDADTVINGVEIDYDLTALQAGDNFHMIVHSSTGECGISEYPPCPGGGDPELDEAGVELICGIDGAQCAEDRYCNINGTTNEGVCCLSGCAAEPVDPANDLHGEKCLHLGETCFYGDLECCDVKYPQYSCTCTDDSENCCFRNTACDGIICPLGTIGDFIWYDANGDGIQDTEEPGLEGFGVQLTNDLGEQHTAVTDADGYYLFQDVPRGVYTVSVVSTTDATYVPTTAFSQTGTIISGEDYLEADFGYVQGCSTKSDCTRGSDQCNEIECEADRCTDGPHRVTDTNCHFPDGEPGVCAGSDGTAICYPCVESAPVDGQCVNLCVENGIVCSQMPGDEQCNICNPATGECEVPIDTVLGPLNCDLGAEGQGICDDGHCVACDDISSPDNGVCVNRCVLDQVTMGCADQCNDEFCDHGTADCAQMPISGTCDLVGGEEGVCSDGECQECDSISSPQNGVCVNKCLTGKVSMNCADECNDQVCNEATATCTKVPRPGPTQCGINGGSGVCFNGECQECDEVESPQDGICVNECDIPGAVQMTCGDTCNSPVCDKGTASCAKVPISAPSDCPLEGGAQGVCCNGECQGCPPHEVPRVGECVSVCEPGTQGHVDCSNATPPGPDDPQCVTAECDTASGTCTFTDVDQLTDCSIGEIHGICSFGECIPCLPHEERVNSECLSRCDPITSIYEACNPALRVLPDNTDAECVTGSCNDSKDLPCEFKPVDQPKDCTHDIILKPGICHFGECKLCPNNEERDDGVCVNKCDDKDCNGEGDECNDEEECDQATGNCSPKPKSGPVSCNNGAGTCHNGECQDCCEGYVAVDGECVDNNVCTIPCAPVECMDVTCDPMAEEGKQCIYVNHKTATECKGGICDTDKGICVECEDGELPLDVNDDGIFGCEKACKVKDCPKCEDEVNHGDVCSIATDKECYCKFDDGCETAWAYANNAANNDSLCFSDPDDGLKLGKWGWTNRITVTKNCDKDTGLCTTQEQELILHAGAGKCDTDKGEEVGTVTLIGEFDGGTTLITYQAKPTQTIKQVHLYVGDDYLPTVATGEGYTGAPGQFDLINEMPELRSYTFKVSGIDINDLNSDVYWIAAHAVACDLEARTCDGSDKTPEEHCSAEIAACKKAVDGVCGLIYGLALNHADACTTIDAKCVTIIRDEYNEAHVPYLEQGDIIKQEGVKDLTECLDGCFESFGGIDGMAGAPRERSYGIVTILLAVLGVLYYL